MAESTITRSTGLFEPKQVAEIFNRVAGHSSIAKLCGQKPIPFAGVESYIFTMDGEASIVGEGANKPAGSAGWAKVLVKPVKVVYQHRLTDEFRYMADEIALPYLEQFMDGIAKKMGRALDIIAMHGLDPATKTKSTLVGSQNFDDKITETVTYDEDNPDENIQDAVTAILKKDRMVNGIIITPDFGTAMGALKEKTGSRVPMYPEFRFGGIPQKFGGMSLDANTTLSFNNSKDKAIIGDFTNAFKWGYTNDIKTEMIEYGNPDGLGDLKQMNQICLRAECYIAAGIIDPDSFVRIVEAATETNPTNPTTPEAGS